MPVMNGYEATAKLKEMMRNGELPYRDIIGCTAFVMDKELQSCYNVGMDDVLIKPVDPLKLRNLFINRDFVKKFWLRYLI